MPQAPTAKRRVSSKNHSITSKPLVRNDSCPSKAHLLPPVSLMGLFYFIMCDIKARINIKTQLLSYFKTAFLFMSLDTILAHSTEKSTTSILCDTNYTFTVTVTPAWYTLHIYLFRLSPDFVCEPRVTTCSHSLHSGLCFSQPL